jgi:hypothetical protein
VPSRVPCYHIDVALADRFGRWLAKLAGQPVEIHHLRGFRVVVENSRPDIASADVVQRLDESLALVERYQPWRLRHLRRDLVAIRVQRFPCRGAYFRGERVCMVELTFLARRDIGAATVASTIVHEGMHARCDMFCEPGVPRDAAREERICRRAELDFGLALPTDIGAPVVERAQASLALADEEVAPDVDWHEAMRRVQSTDDRR